MKLDGLGRLALIGGFLYGSVAIGMMVVRLVSHAENERTPSTSSWEIGAGIGAVLSLAVVLFLRRSWRRRGGQRIVRRSRLAIRTGELPDSMSERAAVLLELERQTGVQDERIPAVARCVLWTLFVALNLVSEHALLDVVAWLLVWPSLAVATLTELPERKRRRTRQRLIDRLREDLVETPGATEDAAAAAG